MAEATLDPEIPGYPPPVRYPSRASIALQLMQPPAQFPYMSGTTNQAQTSVLSYGASASDGTSNPYGISNPLGTSTPYRTPNPCGTRGLNSDNYVFCWKPSVPRRSKHDCGVLAITRAPHVQKEINGSKYRLARQVAMFANLTYPKARWPELTVGKWSKLLVQDFARPEH
ncbi:hypothetical protein EDB80DRAFT_842982 [Ilyonectria destructans]|nr:hypothetical protein EDB80DRAFT_842982 [Ilyonectria destructans]